MTDLPVIGAALTVDVYEAMIALMREAPRDVELQDFCDPDVLAADWRPLAERARQLLAGHPGRIGIHGPFWGLDMSTPDPDIRAVVTRRYLAGLDACAAVGADLMVVHSPYKTWDAHNLDMVPSARRRLVERCHDCLRPVVRRAEDMGVTLVIENIEDRDPRDRVELARSFASPGVAVSIDTGHAFYAHGSTGAPPVDYFVHAAGDLLRHVHLQDADGYADRHWSLGDGSIPWAPVFEALGRLAEMPRLIVELRDLARIGDSIRYLAGRGLGR